jgi:tetratricopeptide (TPR) repeat protein
VLDTVPVAALYFRLLWGIPPFCIDYSDMPGHLRSFSPGVVSGLAVILLWAGAAAWGWRREKFRSASLGLLWLGLFLLPVVNVVSMMQFAAERFLYVPLIGAVLALAAVLAQIPGRRLAPGVMAGLVLLWVPMALSREGIWRDEVTLFVRSSLDHPGNKRLHENAVAALLSLPQMESMFGIDDTTRRLTAARAVPKGRGDAILQTLGRARALFPDEERFTVALAITHAMLGQISNAIPLLELATRQSTNDAQCWMDLGVAYSLARDTNQARAAWQTALRLQPANEAARNHLAASEHREP